MFLLYQLFWSMTTFFHAFKMELFLLSFLIYLFSFMHLIHVLKLPIHHMVNLIHVYLSLLGLANYIWRLIFFHKFGNLIFFTLFVECYLTYSLVPLRVELLVMHCHSSVQLPSKLGNHARVMIRAYTFRAYIGYSDVTLHGTPYVAQRLSFSALTTIIDVVSIVNRWITLL